ncbi:MAG: CfrBI family restriction endonuclease [Chloroflexi bacterium]|nr:CfrBI family restriction endonuclease [Chloroflexota bacterium]MBI5828022.1 CfrBI family restriction endonuclease [Chloroflexota bacterium]
MDKISLNELFPTSSRVLLTGGGKEFIERIGIEAAKRVVLGVLLGENIRKQTEPLTRRRIAQISGAMVALFVRGFSQAEDFGDHLSNLAVQQLSKSKKNDKASVWLARWAVGLTGKSDQNVLRSDPKERDAYIAEFESAILESAARCRADIGDVKMTLGFVEDKKGNRVELDWEDITRLTTAIGSLTLTIRGSDKSTYGKLFERLILGSVLSILGFQRVERKTNTKTRKVFWLADSSDTRECDATLLYQPGKLVRFDIGFIGPGNSEISKDKLTRYAREMEIGGAAHTSQTFIVVDRLPNTSKTRKAAERIEAEIIQMSMQYWPRDLAKRLEKRVGYIHPLSKMPDGKIEDYLRSKLETIRIQDFLSGVLLNGLESDDIEAAEE